MVKQHEVANSFKLVLLELDEEDNGQRYMKDNPSLRAKCKMQSSVGVQIE